MEKENIGSIIHIMYCYVLIVSLLCVIMMCFQNLLYNIRDGVSLTVIYLGNGPSDPCSKPRLGCLYSLYGNELRLFELVGYLMPKPFL